MFARIKGSNTVNKNQFILSCANCYLWEVTQNFSRTAHNLSNYQSGLNYILHNYIIRSHQFSVAVLCCWFHLVMGVLEELVAIKDDPYFENEGYHPYKKPCKIFLLNYYQILQFYKFSPLASSSCSTITSPYQHTKEYCHTHKYNYHRR